MTGRTNVSPFRSPVVGQVLARRSGSQALVSSVAWGVLNFLVAAQVAYDLKYGSWLSSLAALCLPQVLLPLLVLTEYVVCVACSLSLLLHAARVLSTPYVNVKMTTAQSKLLRQVPGDGVMVSDLYRNGLPPDRVARNGPSAASSSPIGMNVSPLGGRGGGYVSMPGMYSPFRSGARTSADSSYAGSTPGSLRSRHHIGSGAGVGVVGSMSTPTHRIPLQGDGTIGNQHSLSSYLQQSPLSGNHSNANNSSRESLTRSSFNESSMFGASFGGFGPGGGGQQVSPPVSLPHPDMTTRDFSPMSSRYQVASRSPSPSPLHGAAVGMATPDGGRQKYMSAEVWSVLGVDRSKLDLWTEKCRRWLAKEILQPLVKEIDSLNKLLRDGGCSQLQLGVSESHAIQKAGLVGVVQQLPHLSLVLNYLDVSANQDYLVWRIRELARGTCLSAFRWDGGGGRPGGGGGDHRHGNGGGGDWDASLPTDAGIVFHLFCTFMDACLPPSPRIPDRRTFTLQYVQPLGAGSGGSASPGAGGGAGKSDRTSAQSSPQHSLHHHHHSPGHSSRTQTGGFGGTGPSTSSSSSSPFAGLHSSGGGSKSEAAELAHLSPEVCFVHSAERPPHYQLLVAGKTVDVGAGRNNLLHSVLYFLYFVKKTKRGVLGTVNLPLADINVLAIVDDS